jgi:hypothetical protein
MKIELATQKSTSIALAPAANVDPFEAYADAVSPRNIVGTLLKFSKGDYLAGEEGTVIPAGTTFTANLDELLVGWVRWRDNKPVEHIMQRVADGAGQLKRDELGDQDQSTWEVDSASQPRDPWQFTNYLPLINEQGELFTFTTSSRGGLGAMSALARLYAWHRRRHPDVFPVIALNVDSYSHKNREYGRIKIPRFTIIRWEPKARFNEALVAAGLIPAEEAQSETGQADKLDDEIVF